MTGTLELGWVELALASALLLVHAAAGLVLHLGTTRQLFVAALRAGVQLFLLGFFLRWIFNLQSPLAVLLLCLAMASVAGVEAMRRTTRRVPGLLGASVSVVVVGSLSVTAYAIGAVLRPDPFWEPRYVIPILGMVLGNTLNGIALGLETAMAGFDEGRARVEALLAFGATRAEASAEVVRRAVRTGLLPILGSMVAAGLISIPGMMTGQILAGEDPSGAARYQIFILFCIAGAVALSTTGAVWIVSRLVFDGRDRLRTDRIRRL